MNLGTSSLSQGNNKKRKGVLKYRQNLLFDEYLKVFLHNFPLLGIAKTLNRHI